MPSPPLIVLAAVWFYVVVGVYAPYRVMRLSAAIYKGWHRDE